MTESLNHLLVPDTHISELFGWKFLARLRKFLIVSLMGRDLLFSDPVIGFSACFFNSELTGTVQSKMRDGQTIQFSSNYNDY